MKKKNLVNSSLTLLVMGIHVVLFGQTNFENLGINVNTPYSELRPTVSLDGKKLFFEIQQKKINNKKSSNSNQEVWFSIEDSAGTWTKAERCSAPINSQRDNAVFWTSLDGNTILIRGAFENGKYLGRGFSISNKNGLTWSDPQRLKIKGYNSMSVDEYDGAFLSNDGTRLFLYMSEEKNSGLNDIYISFLQKDSEWTVPNKILDSVSTDDYDEISPFLSADGITMYFSSNRPGGFGGYDIWKSKRLDDTWLNWSHPVNLGGSANSAKWDAYFSTDAKAEFGYISSSSNSIGGSDIGRIKLSDAQKPNPVVYVSGKIQSDNLDDSMQELKVVFNEMCDVNHEHLNDDIASVVNPKEKSYKAILPYGKKYVIKITAKNYQTRYDTLDLSAKGNYKEINNQVDLRSTSNLFSGTVSDNAPTDTANAFLSTKKVNQKKKTQDVNSFLTSNPDELKVGEVFLINNILFDFSKSTLKQSSYKQLNQIVAALKKNPKLKIELSAHTDNIGSASYNIKLSRERAKTSTRYILSKGVSSKRITSKGYGEARPLASNKTANGRRLNRRVELKVIKK